MNIKKFTTNNYELIPQLFLHKNQQGRKIHQPLSSKFMWLQKYAHNREQTIEQLDQFMKINEFTTYNDQDDDRVTNRNYSKKLKQNTSVNQENSSRSRLMGINLNQLNILCYKNDNKKALVKQKQNLQNDSGGISLVMGAHNSQNHNKRFHCKSTDICTKKYESHQLSARKRYNLSNLHNNRNTQIVNKLQFKKSYNVLKSKYRLPTSKTARRVNPQHQTINIKNTYSERNTHQRKYSANLKTHKKILSNKQNQIEQLKNFKTYQEQQQQKQQNKLSYAKLQKMKMELMSQNYIKNKYNNQKRIRKKSALHLSERDNNIDINPWKHQESQISFQQINLTYQ